MIVREPLKTCKEDSISTGQWDGATQKGFVDIHCHCLPNLDDGPLSVEESLILCRALLNDDIRLVVATPHQLGRFETRTTAERIRAGVRRLNRELLNRRLDLTVFPGAEIRLDERICTLLARGEILTLANRRRHVLLELPGDAFIDIEPLLRALVSQGLRPILAHPERNAPLLRHLHRLSRWRACGLWLQVTAGSITGALGRRAEEAAQELLARGWIEIIATDAHDAGANGPCMREAFARVEDEFGRKIASLLCIENPMRVAMGQRAFPVLCNASQEV